MENLSGLTSQMLSTMCKFHLGFDIQRPWLIGRCSFAANIITNEEGKKMQATVWKEILEVLEAVVPEAKAIAHPKS
jgi:hypothetical protein